ncbi:hypothetical protein WR25_03076 [Diploscapter pachys]|uniref:Major sperm protein n=1 Tax=Diploscapter pachys TaxID=2018661 RepID=A0A2A2L613_9BILA|nr:hypothetical protein WR25_03076 [Diploscapter pachys]
MASLTADPPATSVRTTNKTADNQTLSSDVVVLPAAGGTSTHKLVNGGAEKLMFKVKSSNNNEYRVKPVFGFVDAGGSTDLVVTRLAGAPKEDKLVVHFAPAPADATDAQAAFGSAQPSGSVTIPLTAT